MRLRTFPGAKTCSQEFGRFSEEVVTQRALKPSRDRAELARVLLSSSGGRRTAIGVYCMGRKRGKDLEQWTSSNGVDSEDRFAVTETEQGMTSPSTRSTETENEAAPTEQEVKKSVDDKKIGWALLPFLFNGSDENPEKQDDEPLEEDSGESVPFIDFLSPSAGVEEDVPEITKNQIILSCLSTNFVFIVMSSFVRGVAEKAPSVVGTDPQATEALLSIPPNADWTHIFVVLAVVGLVTAARVGLLKVWPDFAAATNISNKQVLGPLNFGDIVLISFLSGVSEELLFRGNLLPAIAPDWRGVLATGLAFGALHNSGGRNWAFAAWASVVGSVYGLAFVATQDLYVPVVAHSLANIASAVLWLNDNKGDGHE